MFKNAKIYDDPVQIIKTGNRISKIRANVDKSKIYTEFIPPNSSADKKVVLYANKTDAHNLYLGAYDSNREIFVFRKVTAIYEPKICYDKDVDNEELREYDVRMNGSFFDCSNESARTEKADKNIREENAILMEYFHLYRMLKRLVVVNTKEFVNAASYNSRIDKMSIITFLNNNTTRFKGRKILNNSFYDDCLREKRTYMMENYDVVDASKMKKFLGDDFFLYEELHVEENYTYRLKGYDEKVEDEEMPIQNDYKVELIDIMVRKHKMVSVRQLMKDTVLSYDQIMNVFSQKNYVRLRNEKYTPLVGDYQPIRNQVLDILKHRDKLKKKELTYDDESHFKAVVREFCNFEKGVWKLKP